MRSRPLKTTRQDRYQERDDLRWKLLGDTEAETPSHRDKPSRLSRLRPTTSGLRYDDKGLARPEVPTVGGHAKYWRFRDSGSPSSGAHGASGGCRGMA